MPNIFNFMIKTNSPKTYNESPDSYFFNLLKLLFRISPESHFWNYT